MQHLYYLISKCFYILGYFPGSSRIQHIILKILPLRLGRISHPLGFSWMISSRGALNTYLSSCEAFTTKLVLFRAIQIDSFICVGANRGWYPLAVGAINKKVKIMGFECNTSIYSEFCKNVFENRNQSELFQYGISDHAGLADLYMPTNGNEGMSTLYPLEEASQQVQIIEKVKLTTLDVCLADKLGTFGRTLILMDIEGSEMLALKGASRLMENCAPDLILEVNDELLRQAGSSAKELLQYLHTYDYEAYWIDERGHLSGVGKNNELPHRAILPPDSGANYLFVKKNVTWMKKYIKN